MNKERGYINLIDYVKADSTEAEIDKLKKEIINLWQTLSTDWQESQPTTSVKIQLEQLNAKIGEFQTIIVADSTSAELTKYKITETAVEEILIALAKLLNEKVDTEEYTKWKKLITSSIDKIEALLSLKQDEELKEETLEALDLGDDVKTVEDALIALKIEAGKNIMCEAAQQYYEDQYHNLFDVDYSMTCVMSPASVSIDPKTTPNKTVTIKATISGTAKVKQPTDTTTKTLTLTSEPEVAGWTIVSAECTDTKKVYTKTVTLAEVGEADYSYKSNVSVKFPSTAITYKKWDPTTITEIETEASASVENSTSITISRKDFYWTNIQSIDADAFNTNYKTAKTFTIGTKNTIVTGTNMPIIFCSQTANLKFTSMNVNVLDPSKPPYTIKTNIGDYYVYTSNPMNGSSQDIDIAK